MTTIVTRAGKGSALTHTELDNNFTNLNTDKVEASGDSMTGNLSFGDNNKAVFGAGSDLQIYHDGSNSYISDQGTGNLNIQANQLRIQSDTGENFIECVPNAQVVLRYDNNVKLQTTATGIDVTGTVTADGLTVDGASLISDAAVGSVAPLIIQNANSTADNAVGIKLVNSTNSTYGNYSEIQAVRKADSSSGLNFITSASLTQTNRMFIDSTGDISFYEDTGTTAKFFWDASAESLGIGTTTPNFSLDVEGTGTLFRVNATSGNCVPQISVSDATSITGINFGDSGSTFAGAIYYRHTGDSMAFTTAGSEAMRISSAGNIGIGTTTPSWKIEVDNGIDADLIQVVRGGGDGYVALGLNGSNAILTAGSAGVAEARNLVFQTATSGGVETERARIDSSGNLLVGKTSTSFSTAGIQLNNDGQTVIIKSSGSPLYARRTTDSGHIIEFAGVSATIGYVGGNSSGYLYTGAVDTALIYDNGNNSIQPYQPNIADYRDNAVDLGASSARFRDLYLSGGVYLGGTGAANLLDDYEEGTFTPTLRFGGLDTGNVYATQSGYYTKIGDVVHFYVYVRLSTIGSATGNAEIYNLPFTANASVESGGAVAYFAALTALTSTPIVRISGATLELRDASATDAIRLSHGNFTNTSDIRISGSYKV